MESLKRIKEDLIGALITLGENGLSDKDKIKNADEIILETLKFTDEIISEKEKQETYIAVAAEILSEKHPNSQITSEEYRDGDVCFQFHISAHDYSAGKDSDTITKKEIERKLITKL